MQSWNSDLFLMLYYAAGAGIFVLALIPLVLVGFFVFSMVPSMLFSRFYDRMYKKLGFLPEITLFLACCTLAAALTFNIMHSQPLCTDPLAQGPAERLAFYQVTAGSGATVRSRADGPSLGKLPQGTIVYSPLARASATAPILATRVILPQEQQAVALTGLIAATDAAPGRFLQHPFAFAGYRCQPAFLLNWRTLLRWPWPF